MAVGKLLQYVGPLLRNTNIYAVAAGQWVGVDGHVWLHNFAYHWAEDILYRQDYTPLAREFLQQAQFVIGHGLKLLFVFDGAPTPAKYSTDQQRQRRRQEAYSRVVFGEDSTPSSAAVKAALTLGWPAVKAVISLLRTQGIPYIVAPYEADAQVALLAQSGHVWAAATIDSDFIIHGIERVFFRVT